MTTIIKKYILGGGFLVSLVGWILSIVGLFRRPLLGSLFSKQWSYPDIPSSFTSHRITILVTGFIGFLGGLLLLILIGFYLYKIFARGDDLNEKLLVVILIQTILIFVMGIISIVFNSDLNDPIWIAQKAMEEVMNNNNTPDTLSLFENNFN